VLCNQGIVYDSLGRPDEARSRYEAALAVARELGDRRSEGQVLGYLGLLHARQAGSTRRAPASNSGEALLRAMSDRLSLGVLLCCRPKALNSPATSTPPGALSPRRNRWLARAGRGPIPNSAWH